jgi:hypothetical protein
MVTACRHATPSSMTCQQSAHISSTDVTSGKAAAMHVYLGRWLSGLHKWQQLLHQKSIQVPSYYDLPWSARS